MLPPLVQKEKKYRYLRGVGTVDAGPLAQLSQDEESIKVPLGCGFWGLFRGGVVIDALRAPRRKGARMLNHIHAVKIFLEAYLLPHQE